MRAATWMTVIGVGAAVALGVAFLTAEDDVKFTREGPRSEAEGASREGADDERTAALERELASLRREVRRNGQLLAERTRGEPGAEDSAGEGGPGPAEHVPSREEEAKLLQERFAAMDRKHISDPVDPTWAPEAEGILQQGLAALKEQSGIEILEAECKTEVCRAKVEWENYSEAMKTGGGLAEADLPGLNCAQSIWLEEPSEADSPYSTYLYLNCQGMRVAQAEMAN